MKQAISFVRIELSSHFNSVLLSEGAPSARAPMGNKGEEMRTSSSIWCFSPLTGFARSVLAALFAAALVFAGPLLGAGEPGGQAWAMEGTTDYAKVFSPTNYYGAPASITGSTLRVGSTLDPSHYGWKNDFWESSSGFAKKLPISLQASWELSFTSAASGFSSNPMYSRLGMHYIVSLRHGGVGYSWIVERIWTPSQGLQDAMLSYIKQKDAFADDVLAGPVQTGWCEPLRIIYDAKADTITLTNGSTKTELENARSQIGDNPFLDFGGGVNWWHEYGQSSAYAPQNMWIKVQFNSLVLPNLSPAIESVQIFRSDGVTPIAREDSVAVGEKVLVSCTVRNLEASAENGDFKERYAMHLKVANTSSNPTMGITPFVDADHPTKINGTSLPVVSGKEQESVTGDMGAPLNLVGSEPTVVTYWATVTGTEGGAVKLSQELVEDCFQGSHFATTLLINERPLISAPSDVDPGDPSSWSGGGTAFHYLRHPQPNENGWNASSVSVKFFGGNYDSFIVTPENGDSPTHLANQEAWTRTKDTPGYAIGMQAVNSTTGAVSVHDSDIVKIDTSAPRLSVDPALGTVLVDDRPLDSSKATSGVWRLYRTDAPASLGARSADYREFDLADGCGQATQTVAGLPSGTYVAEDAAGNKSLPLKIGLSDPPSVTVRPGPGDTPSRPLAPTAPPKVDSDGTKHAEVSDELTIPAKDERMTSAALQTLLDNRYEFTSFSGAPVKKESLAIARVGGVVVDAIDRSKPGAFDITYVVVDDAGNTTTVHLRLLVVAEAPDVLAPDGDGGKREPLVPSDIEVDKDTGLVRQTVNDRLVTGTHEQPVTAQMMATLFSERYELISKLADGRVNAGPVRLFDESGNVVDVIDRSRPGIWLAEQEVTDSAGNTTLIRLAYEVREGEVSVLQEAGKAGSGRGNTKDSGDFATTTLLPKTADLLSACPLHLFFMLLIVLMSVYAMMRLRQLNNGERGERDGYECA